MNSHLKINIGFINAGGLLLNLKGLQSPHSTWEQSCHCEPHLYVVDGTSQVALNLFVKFI